VFGINRRAVGILFGIVALAFIVGSIFLFTPQGQRTTKGKAELFVNNKPIYELDVARAQQGDQVLATNPSGIIKVLAQSNFVENLTVRTALEQDSSRVRVSSADVRSELNKQREQAGLKDQKAYEQALGQLGLTDAQVRTQLGQQLKIQRRLEGIQKAAKTTDEEVKLYFELNKDQYKTEDRVEARQIVVDDKKTADDLYKQLQGGADFAELAKKNSKVGAEQSGALGAESGKSEPKPVTKVVFPNAIADAVFKLKNGGLTAPIEAGGRFYIINVQKFLLASSPSLEEVKTKVTEDVQKLKGNGALEAFLDALRKKTQVKIAEGSTLKYDNPVVAKVGDEEIKLTDLTQQVFANPQLGQFLQQGMGELAVQFFMPQTLEQIITQKVVLAEAKKLGQPFVGSEAAIVRDAQLWKTKDISVSDADVKKHYDTNLTNFTVPATAKVVGVKFKAADKAKADAFRTAALKGGKLDDLVKAQAGEKTDYGTPKPGDLPPVTNKLVFLTKANFPKGPLGEVSEVVKLDDGSFEVLLVNERVAERLKPFSEVAEEAKNQVLSTKRAEAGTKWIEGLRKAAKVEDKLKDVLATLTPKAETKPEGTTPADASKPAETKPAESTPAQPATR
jgi:parvulin-like peptidyl-prolyl isomerase